MIGIILAAGKGTRMKSDIHKGLHKVCNKPMIRRIYEQIHIDELSKVILVVGNKKEQILDEFKEEIALNKVDIVEQVNLDGTASALKLCSNLMDKYKEDVLITYADVPLVSRETYSKLYSTFKENNADMIVLTATVDNPTGYGRIIKKDNEVENIVEQLDADEKTRKIKEINTGIYIYKYDMLLKTLPLVKNNNAKKEYYLTDTINILYNLGYKPLSCEVSDVEEINGVNDRLQLNTVNRLFGLKILKKHILNGVDIINIDNTYIDEDTTIESGAIIYPNVHIVNSKIGASTIYENTRIENSKIGDNCVIKSSYIYDSEIKNNSKIGPFAHIRPNTIIEENVKVGNFVEVKNTKIDNNSKCGHLTYLGDTEIGKNVNIGAGTITCNYDGHKKYKTIIEDNTFIGSNTIIVAPTKIGKNSLTAAGSVITKEVPNDTLAFARAKQVNKIDYYKGDKENE